MYTLIRIVQSFSAIEAVDKDAPWRENLTVTLSTYCGCQVRLFRTP